MRICFFIGNLGSGGAERTLQYLADYGVNNGYEVDVVTLNNIKFYEIDEKINYFTFDTYRKRGIILRFFHFFKRLRCFRKYLRQNKPDVIFALLSGVLFYAYFAPRKYVVIGSERGNPKGYPNKFKVAIRDFSYNHADGMIFQTNAALEFYKNRLGLDGVVIPNAVGNPIAYEFDKPSQVRTNRFVAMGRLVKEKDYKTMIDAFDLFYQKNKDYVLEIYGEGDLKNTLIEYKNTLPSKDSIIFMGADKEALRKVYDATGFLLTSISEGMPNALMEAMAIGLPCISTDCPNGPADLIVNGENGILVEMGDAEEISNQMCKIVSDSEFAKRLSLNAIKIKESNSINNISEKFYKYFNDCYETSKKNRKK